MICPKFLIYHHQVSTQSSHGTVQIFSLLAPHHPHWQFHDILGSHSSKLIVHLLRKIWIRIQISKTIEVMSSLKFWICQTCKLGEKSDPFYRNLSRILYLTEEISDLELFKFTEAAEQTQSEFILNSSHDKGKNSKVIKQLHGNKCQKITVTA